MEVLVNAPLDESNDRVDSARVKEIEVRLQEIDPQYSIENTSIGHGADWPVLLLALAGIFLLGEKIEKNLNAWVSLAKRVAGLIGWLSERFGAVRVDESGALALAIEDLTTQRNEISSLLLEHRQTIVFTPVPWNKLGRLDNHPDALYVLSFRVNEQEVFIYGIKSKGIVEFRHTYKVFWGDF